MEPRTSYTKIQTAEDNERLFDAIAIVKKHLPNVDEGKVESFIRVFFLSEAAEKPISLQGAKKILGKLEEAASAYIEILEEMDERLNLQAEYSLPQIDFLEQIQNTTTVRTAASNLMDRLPDTTRWPKEPNHEKELIIRLAALYKESSGREPSTEFKYDRINEVFYGNFHELVKATFLELDIPDRDGEGLGHLIKRTLKELSRGNQLK